MLGLYLSSFPKAALIAASLVLSVGATASYADVAQQIAIARGAHLTVHPDARAQYQPSILSGSQSGKCVGSYVWTQRAFNVHRTDNQTALPLPCH